MATCPHCKQELQIQNYVWNNVENYGKSAVATTLCCGAGVRVTPVRSFRVTEYDGREQEDDWGVPFKKEAAR
jgi:hypothetical protein